MVSGMALDKFDCQILRAVQRQGDLTHAQLAEQVHLSASQCARRLERMRQAGYVDRNVTLLNRERLGLSVLAHIFVSLQTHDGARNEAFYAFVREAPEVLECYMQSGDVDLLLKIAIRDLGALADFIDRLIAATGGLAGQRSYIVLRTIKTTNELAIGKWGV